MQAIKRRDTGLERAIRSVLHAQGLRFRVDYLVALPDARAVRVDVAFPRQRLAVMVDGCFWHSCPVHGRVPSKNLQYWPEKLARNRRRDEVVNEQLALLGWRVLRIWEHEDLQAATGRVVTALNA
ncbi:MAG: very short patch repair endonuclease [Solirubrobacterales bacterium]